MIKANSRFQNTNPERGRKRPARVSDKLNVGRISEHEPRKGTETLVTTFANVNHKPISEHEPRKGTETYGHDGRIRRRPCISEHEPRKGTETSIVTVTEDEKATIKFQNTNPERGRKLRSRWTDSPPSMRHFRTRTPKGDGNSRRS